TGFQDGGYDMWGVRQVAAPGTNNATMPDVRNILLPEIDEWKEKVKFPEKPAGRPDYEKMYENSINMFHIDRSRSAVTAGPGFSPFQQLVGMMGFEGGLIALAEDPDTVIEMLNAMIDFMEPYYSEYIDVFKPDLWSLADDSCSKQAPFMSVETYRKVFKPMYERLCKPANDRGIPIMFHNCGHVLPILDDMVDFGVTITDPFEPSNDILNTKAKFKGKLSVVCAPWWQEWMPANYPQYDEEELRWHVRDYIDRYAPGGAFAFYAWPLSYFGDPVIEEVKLIIRDEAYWYGREYMGYTADGPRKPLKLPNKD
ncbi:MAG: hypothetical protein IKN76_00935, partial [Oscillospiraceae bacterium]|nr:hypothetical protein [Oscillospiraceae bacterium]